MENDFVAIGQILKPRGTKGEVDVLSLSDFPERFRPGLRVFLIPPLPDVKELVIGQVLRQPKGMAVTFEGFVDRNDVERLRGRYLAVLPDEISELPEGSYWVDDLIGLEIVTTGGEPVGRVKEVMRGAANDVYVVETPDGDERLIPAVGEIVKRIDLDAGRIIIEPIPGLL